MQFLPDEGLEDVPDQFEDEGLLDHVYLLESQRHGVLDEAQQSHTEGGRQRHHLLHGQPVEVHNDHDTSDLRFRFQYGGLVDQIEDSEELVRGYFRSVPGT